MNYIHTIKTSKKGIFGYKWPILFVLTLILALHLFIVLLNDRSERNDSFYLDALKINNQLQKEQKELELKIMKMNVNAQNTIITEIGDDFSQISILEIRNSYREKINSKIENEFTRWIGRSTEFHIHDDRVYLPKTESTNSISISTNISSKLFFYKDEFLSQVETFQSFQNSISPVQSQINECYQDSFNKNICSGGIRERILNSNEFSNLICSDSSKGLKCLFNVSPFTAVEFEILAIPRQEDRRTIEINSNLLLWSRSSGELEIDTNILYNSGQQIENYFLFLIPDSNYNIESVINFFEEVFRQSLNEGEDNLNHISFEKIEEAFAEYITNNNHNSRSYKIELPQTPPIYLRIISNYRLVSNNELEYIPMSQVISETEFSSDIPHLVFITRNRYFEDTSMYSRGSTISVPPRPTQNPHPR